MLRIRKISDSHTPANRSALEEAQAIIGAQFPGMPASEVARLPDQLRNPFKHRFVAKLLVAEDARGHVKALALLQHDPDLAFSYLEVIRSEEHTSELQSLMRISYAVFCLKKKKKSTENTILNNITDTKQT